VVQGSIPRNSSLFCSFLSIFFLRPSSYWALPLLPFSIGACVLHNQFSFVGGYDSLLHWKCLFLVFLAWSRPSSLTLHFLGIIDWIMRTQLFKSCKWTHYELYLSESIFPHVRLYGITAYIRSYTAYIQYMEIPCTVLANPINTVK